MSGSRTGTHPMAAVEQGTSAAAPTLDDLARSGGATPGVSGSARGVLVDPVAWDARVEASPHGTVFQLRGWAVVKRLTGWRAERAADPSGQLLAQVLVRRPGPFPWYFAYVPRGPVVDHWSSQVVPEATDLLRSAVARTRLPISHIRIDPDVELDGPEDGAGALRAALSAAGWRPAQPIQPVTTRLIDLRVDEAALWSDLRQKWRQYVNRARSLGVRVVEAQTEGIPVFHRILLETAKRGGFSARSEAAYRAVWDAFAADGRCRLLLAETSDGEPVAALFLVRCGGRVAEFYGGMTATGAELRANYLLKWEAIRSSRERGATAYDLWGLATPGIAHFKAGFGGREVRYIGAWDLVVDRLGYAGWTAATAARRWLLDRTRGDRARGRGQPA